MKLRYGIIATATITDRFINAVLEFGDEVLAIASRDIQKAKAKAKQFSIQKAYGSYEALYADQEIDIVYIATNNATHYEEVYHALSHHKHVVCEKPITLSANQTRALFAYAKKQNCFLMEAQKSVFLPITNYIKEHIDTHTLGCLHQVELSSSFPLPTSTWMLDPTQGGVIYGSASYTLEYLDYLIEPKVTYVDAIGFSKPNTACDRVSMNIKMDNVLINSRITMGNTTKNHAIFYFEKGWIEVDTFWKARKCILHHEGKDESIERPVTYEMIYEVEHIHDCIEKGLLQSLIMDEKRSVSCCEWVDKMIKTI